MYNLGPLAVLWVLRRWTRAAGASLPHPSPRRWEGSIEDPRFKVENGILNFEMPHRRGARPPKTSLPPRSDGTPCDASILVHATPGSRRSPALVVSFSSVVAHPLASHAKLRPPPCVCRGCWHSRKDKAQKTPVAACLHADRPDGSLDTIGKALFSQSPHRSTSLLQRPLWSFSPAGWRFEFQHRCWRWCARAREQEEGRGGGRRPKRGQRIERARASRSPVAAGSRLAESSYI